MSRNVLVLSPYDASSHNYWWRGVVRHLPEFTFSVHTLPGRYFSWRFRGNSLTFHDTDFGGDHELLLCTSMTDLSALRGMNASVRNLPAMMYFHENQFAYPTSEPPSHLLERQVTSLYGALAADLLAFNSAYNRDTFLVGVDSLLVKLPDGVPSGIAETLQQRSVILPVPLDTAEIIASGERHRTSESLVLVWNHRWEADKGVDRLLALMRVLVARSFDFKLHILSGDTRKVPAEMVAVQALLDATGHLGHVGFVSSRDGYLKILADADVVLSTAEHEFQGLAVLEAVANGCVPLVPDRLAYRELFAEPYRYPVGSIQTEADLAADRLAQLVSAGTRAPDVSHLTWTALAGDYRRLLGGLAG
jgi:glycosyltransferase involved in cell wall biosynthesis